MRVALCVLYFYNKTCPPSCQTSEHHMSLPPLCLFINQPLQPVNPAYKFILCILESIRTTAIYGQPPKQFFIFLFLLHIQDTPFHAIHVPAPCTAEWHKVDSLTPWVFADIGNRLTVEEISSRMTKRFERSLCKWPKSSGYVLRG